MPPAALTDNLPPQNLEAERAVLGAILLDCSVLIDISLILTPEDFYREAHKQIYQAMLAIWESTQVVDAVILADHLINRDKYKLIGGDEMMMEIANCVPHAANAKYHAEIVKQKSTSRQLVQAATEIVRDGYSQLFTAQQLVESAEQKIFSISQNAGKDNGQVYTMPDAIESYSTILERRRSGEITGLTTGFADLDELILGMSPKQLIYMAARPGAGKTSLAMDISWHVATNLQKKVLFVSLEMAIDELTERMVSSIAGIDSKRLRDPWLLGSITHQEDERITNAMEAIRNANISINDCVGQSAGQISSLARRVKTRSGLDLLVIDYLGKIRKPEGRNMTTNDQVTYISNAMKELSGELRIPVLCLHQLNRDCVKEGVRPQMHHLRDCVTSDTKLINAESGSPILIEQIKPGTLVYSMNQQQKIVANRVADVWPTGKQQVYKITTRSGRTIKSTSNHPFFTSDGWKKLSEIGYGSDIAVAFRGPETASGDLSTEDCRLLGYMIGNGSMQKYRTLGLIIPDDEAFEDARQIILSKWPEMSINARPEHNDAWISRVFENGWGKPGGNPMINWLKDVGCYDVQALTKQIPDLVYRSGKEGISAFLAGYLMTDGCVKWIKKKRPMIHWDTISKSLADGILSLCMRIGVFASVDDGTMNTLSVHPVYRIRVCEDAANMIRLCEALLPYMKGIRGRKLLKAKVACEAKETRSSAFSLPERLSFAASQSYPRWRHQGKKMSRRRLCEIATEISDPYLSMWSSSDIVWDKIVEIQDAGFEQTWDIRIENTHSFVTSEGIVAHNSGALEQDAHGVWLLHNVIPKDQMTGTVELIVDKNRAGATGIVYLTYEKPFTRFSSATQPDVY